MYRRLAVLLAVALGALVVAACASSDDDEPPVTSSSPADSGGPTVAPTEDAFIIYREASGALIAQHIMTGEKYHQEVDFTKEVIVGLQCVPDGSRIAYLKQEFERTDVRQLVIRGDAAPAEPLLLPSSTQSIAWSPDGTQVAVSDYDSLKKEHRLSTLDIATGASAVIDTGPDFAGSVGWSPDGTRLAYYLQPVTEQRANVHVLPLDGGGPQQISSGDISWYDPVWSPDGSRIVVAGLQEEDFQLYALDPDGAGEAVRITESDIFKRGPQFSPSGTLIGYTGSIVVPAVSAMALHSFGIFLMNSDGTDEHAFTVDPRTNPGAQVDPYLDAYLMGFCAAGPWLDDLWVPEQ